MPQERLSMRKISEILRLKYGQNFSTRQIAKCCGIGKSTVAIYLSRAEKAGISWPLPENMTEETLHALLFPQQKDHSVSTPVPDWNLVHQELQKKGVTKFLLWEEYKQANPDGFEYSWFCRHTRTHDVG